MLNNLFRRKRIPDVLNYSAELGREKRRKAAVWRRHDRAMRVRRFFRRAKLPLLIGVLLLAPVWYGGWKLATSPWPVGVTVRHYFARINCDTARRMDLAPARRGQPGYWDHLDYDRDGIACEPFPRR